VRSVSAPAVGPTTPIRRAYCTGARPRSAPAGIRTGRDRRSPRPARSSTSRSSCRSEGMGRPPSRARPGAVAPLADRVRETGRRRRRAARRTWCCSSPTRWTSWSAASSPAPRCSPLASEVRRTGAAAAPPASRRPLAAVAAAADGGRPAGGRQSLRQLPGVLDTYRDLSLDRELERGDWPIGEALLDQRVLAGVGNVYKCEVGVPARRRPAVADGRPARRTA
jgi:hypothetical protein